MVHKSGHTMNIEDACNAHHHVSQIVLQVLYAVNVQLRLLESCLQLLAGRFHGLNCLDAVLHGLKCKRRLVDVELLVHELTTLILVQPFLFQNLQIVGLVTTQLHVSLADHDAVCAHPCNADALPENCAQARNASHDASRAVPSRELSDTHAIAKIGLADAGGTC